MLIFIEVTNERLTILELLKNKGELSSEDIEKETGLSRERVLKELDYLEKIDQISCSGKMLSGVISDVSLEKGGIETLENNKDLWNKIKSKIKGFNISILGTGIGVNF